MASTRTDADPERAPEAPRDPKAIARQRRKDSTKRIWKQYRQSWMGMAGLGILLFFVLIAVFAPLLANKCDLSPICHPTNPSLAPPNGTFCFGTDVQGRSVLSLTIWGSRVSLIVGLAATLITVVIGSSMGLVAGYYGAGVRRGSCRLTDWFLVIRSCRSAIVLSVILKPSAAAPVIFVIGITSWPSTARVIRAQVLTPKKAAKATSSALRARSGSGDYHLVTRHILPNVDR